MNKNMYSIISHILSAEKGFHVMYYKSVEDYLDDYETEMPLQDYECVQLPATYVPFLRERIRKSGVCSVCKERETFTFFLYLYEEKKYVYMDYKIECVHRKECVYEGRGDGERKE